MREGVVANLMAGREQVSSNLGMTEHIRTALKECCANPRCLQVSRNFNAAWRGAIIECQRNGAAISQPEISSASEDLISGSVR